MPSREQMDGDSKLPAAAAVEIFEHNGMTMSDGCWHGLQSYIHRGILPGDFLRAVLENNLSEACARADWHNARNIPAYVAYLYNRAPSACWGSPENVEAWIAHKGLQGS